MMIVAQDQGPGIPNVAEAMRYGCATRRGIGVGLPGAKWLMDEFEIVSKPGKGTKVTMKMARVIRSAPWTLVSHVLVNKLPSRHVADPLLPRRRQAAEEDFTARRAAAQARAQEQRRISRLLHDEIGPIPSPR